MKNQKKRLKKYVYPATKFNKKDKIKLFKKSNEKVSEREGQLIVNFLYFFRLKLSYFLIM